MRKGLDDFLPSKKFTVGWENIMRLLSLLNIKAAHLIQVEDHAYALAGRYTD